MLLRFPAHGKMYLETLILNWTKSPQTETWEMQIDNFTTIQEKTSKKSVQFYAQKIRKYQQKSANIRKNPQIGISPFSGFSRFPRFHLNFRLRALPSTNAGVDKQVNVDLLLRLDWS